MSRDSVPQRCYDHLKEKGMATRRQMASRLGINKNSIDPSLRRHPAVFEGIDTGRAKGELTWRLRPGAERPATASRNIGKRPAKSGRAEERRAFVDLHIRGILEYIATRGTP